jgi:hypothetical protein
MKWEARVICMRKFKNACFCFENLKNGLFEVAAYIYFAIVTFFHVL